MSIMIFLIILIIGVINSVIINEISFGISTNHDKELNILVVLISSLVLLISYIRFGLDIIFVKSVVLSSILIITSFVDFRYQIIPDRLVFITFTIGLLFLFSGDVSFVSSLLGMLIGGGLLFLLALIPGALGGGDIKLMFALGLFLGLNKTLYALFFAFVLASFISLILLVFKVKGRKDYIPFGPFLALGSFLSFLLNI